MLTLSERPVVPVSASGCLLSPSHVPIIPALFCFQNLIPPRRQLRGALVRGRWEFWKNTDFGVTVSWLDTYYVPDTVHNE